MRGHGPPAHLRPWIRSKPACVHPTLEERKELGIGGQIASYVPWEHHYMGEVRSSTSEEEIREMLAKKLGIPSSKLILTRSKYDETYYTTHGKVKTQNGNVKLEADVNRMANEEETLREYLFATFVRSDDIRPVVKHKVYACVREKI
jgi:hypothetical protein